MDCTKQDDRFSCATLLQNAIKHDLLKKALITLDGCAQEWVNTLGRIIEYLEETVHINLVLLNESNRSAGANLYHFGFCDHPRS